MHAHRPTKSRKRATALMTTIIMISVASMMSISLLRFTVDMNHVNEKRLDGTKAFYIAEAGIEQVKHYFNFPNAYPPDADANAAPEDCLFYYRFDPENHPSNPETYPNLETAIAGGEYVLDSSDYPVFTGPDGTVMGRVKRLSILPPDNSDPVPCFAKLQSIGETRSSASGNQEETIIVYFSPGTPYVQSTAAIISKNVTAFNGNIEPHWGEVWARNPIDLIGGIQKQDLENYLGGFLGGFEDPWTRVRTEGYFYSDKTSTLYYLDGRYEIPSVGYGSTTPIAETDLPYYYQPMTGTSFKGVDLTDRFYQYKPLPFPEYDYELWKTLAQRQAPVDTNRSYYTTQLDANGKTKIYRANGTLVSDVMTEFFSNAPGSEFRIIFIDTLDGQPPDLMNGSNLGNLAFSGGSPHLRGVFNCNANVGFTGTGNPPTINCEKPDGTFESLSKVFVDGLIYIAGSLGVDESFGGNMKVYGSLVVEGEIDATGNPEVYYNHRLLEGMYFPLGSRVHVSLFRVL